MVIGNPVASKMLAGLAIKNIRPSSYWLPGLVRWLLPTLGVLASGSWEGVPCDPTSATDGLELIS